MYRKFEKFTGKHLWQSLFFHKVACIRPASLFSCESCKISENTFPTEHVRWLFLSFFPKSQEHRNSFGFGWQFSSGTIVLEPQFWYQMIYRSCDTRAETQMHCGMILTLHILTITKHILHACICSLK